MGDNCVQLPQRELIPLILEMPTMHCVIQVFMWGLIHVEESSEGDGGGNVAARGDARAMLGIHNPANTVLRRIVQESESRWLSAMDQGGDVTTASTATVGDDQGHTVEDNGNQSAEAEPMSETGIENDSSGAFRMTNRRRKVAVPRPVPSLAGRSIKSVAAGFGHSLALGEDGVVYSCGYNDRGQLGLGHRHNASAFARIDGPLRHRFVVQVACGGQHNLCRVLLSSSSSSQSSLPAGLAPHPLLPCELFVWGNGSLGQLGLGRDITGRRLPTLLSPAPWYGEAVTAEFEEEHLPPRRIEFPTFVAAGSNHSVCICDRCIVATPGAASSMHGAVPGDDSMTSVIYSWGHGEYGQHGSVQNVSSSDLVDAFFFYTPRRVPLDHLFCNDDDDDDDDDESETPVPPLSLVPDAASPAEALTAPSTRRSTRRFVEAACGSCFSLASTSRGEVASWGWNSFGCLGHGPGATGCVAHPPAIVATLGARFDAPAFRIAAGGSHASAVARSSVSDRGAAGRMRRLLPAFGTKSESESSTAGGEKAAALFRADVFLSVDAAPKTSRGSREERRFFAHRVVLETRCPKLRELFGAAETAAAEAPSSALSTDAASETGAPLSRERDGAELQRRPPVQPPVQPPVPGRRPSVTPLPGFERRESGVVGSDSADRSLVGVSLSHLGTHANSATVLALLVYLYTDTLEAP